MTIYLDTDVIPRKGPLKSGLLDALLRVAQARELSVAVPEMVVHESVNARLDSVRVEIEKLRKAVATASEYFDLEPLYLPEPEVIAGEWEAQLRASLTVLADDPNHALEALRREARRVRPAAKGKGGRDALIWLTIVEDAKLSQDANYFVSHNTSDFAAPNGALHNDLAQELNAHSVNLEYASSIEQLLTRLSQVVNFEVSRDHVLNEDLSRKVFVSEILTGPWIDQLPEQAHESTDSSSEMKIKFESVRTRRSYKVDGTTLASVTTSWAVSTAVGAATEARLSIDLDAWFVFLDDNLSGVEIHAGRAT